jgi:ATP-binding cassette subfamily B protein
LQRWVTGFFAFAVVTELTFAFRIKLALEVGEAVIRDVRAALFRHWLRLTMSYFNANPVGRLISRLTGDAENVRAGVQNVLFVSLVQVGQMIGCAVFMILDDWVMFLLVLGMAPVVWLLNRIFRSRLSKAYRRQSDSYSRITATMAESVSGIRVTQSFGRGEVNAGLFRDLAADHARVNFAAARTSGTFLPLLELNGQLFMALLIVAGGWRVLHPQIAMPLGSMVQFFFLAGLFFSPITVLGNMFNEALNAMAGAEKVFAILDSPPDWEDPPDAVEVPAFQGRVEFEDVYFSYQPGRPVLRGVSFVAEPGQTVAIVGATGGGKSTLAGLAAKFYLPSSGVVRLDGIDTRRLSSPWLHRHLAIVPQQNHLFGGTLLENIRLARPEASREEVRDALRRLDCLELFDSLPQGLDTGVGERGTALSLGQRQLACFARALLADPRILILDEATSAIDPITEKKTQKAMRRLLSGRTSFVVAHRLSTLRHADLVLVLDHGELVECGPPGELLERDAGRFRALWVEAGMAEL